MATVNFFLDTRKTDEGFGIIKLRITHNRKQNDYSTKIKISVSLFNKLKKQGEIIDGRIKDVELINIHNLLFAKKDNTHIYEDGFILRARTIIQKLGNNFSFDVFKIEFDNYGKLNISVHEKTDIIKVLSDKCILLKSKGQLSHGTNFDLVAKSLSRFVEYLQINEPNRLLPKRNFILRFNHIDSSFLTDWSKWMKEYGKTPKKQNSKPTGATTTTIGIYSRTLRTVFNEAIADKVIDSVSYPFGIHGFVPPVGQNIKKSLTNGQIESIKSYIPQLGSYEQRSLDLWLFSYFGNGMNFTDILNLKWENITNDTITFQRQKTKGSPTTINVRLNDVMKEIIERWQNERKNSKDFIFPFLNDIESLEKQKAVVHQTIKVTNKYMNQIAKKLGIESDVNTYHARHSFATRMMRSNAPLMLIKEKLGHKKVSTTENYLGSFDKEIENEYLDML